MQTTSKRNWLFLLLFSSSVYSFHGHYYVNGSAGFSAAHQGNRAPQIIYYNGGLIDSYPLFKREQNKLVLGANAGYEFLGRGLMPALALGLGFYGIPQNYNYTGQLIETADGGPTSLLYNYYYRANSHRLMAEAQLSWFWGNVAPFLNVGIGTAWNELKDYFEAPTNASGYVVYPPFANHNNNNFAYQFGAGLSYRFNFTNEKTDFKAERFSVGYRYVNLGSNAFESRGAFYPYRLNTGTLYMDEVYFTYTHLF